MTYKTGNFGFQGSYVNKEAGYRRVGGRNAKGEYPVEGATFFVAGGEDPSQRYTGETPYGTVTDGKLGGPTPVAKPNWIDGTSTPSLPTENRRAPIVPISLVQSAILVGEDEASLDSKSALSGNVRGNRPVIDRNTGRARTEEEELKRRTAGAILLG